jgi:hypothetical protein
MALFGPRAMSDLSPLCAPRRTPRRPGGETLDPRCPIPIPTHSPIATPSSATAMPSPPTHTASVMHCIDGEIIGWLERQERRRRDTRKAAKVFLDGSCRCICVEVLCRAVLERSPCSLLFWTHATFNEAVGALPVYRANDPRSLRHVTGGDALQASTAVPFEN